MDSKYKWEEKAGSKSHESVLKSKFEASFKMKLCNYHSLGAHVSYIQMENQPLPAITSVCFSHYRVRPSVCWISINKDVLYEFHWLVKLQSRSSHKCGNVG